jgi:signal transduction histidine kinase
MSEKDRFVKKFIEKFEKIDPNYIELFITRLTRERNFFKDLVNLLDEGILVLNEHREIMVINDAALKILNIIDEDPTGKIIDRYIYDNQLQIFFNKIWDLPDKSINTEIQLDAPQKTYLGVTIMNYDDEDEESVRSKVFVFTDITERIVSMEKLLKNEKMQTFNLLSAGVAHEIGNPLNSLDIHMQLLEKELAQLDHPSVPELQELVRISREEISRLDSIISRFLNTVRPFQLKLKENDISEAVKAQCAAISAELHQQNITLLNDFSGQIPLFLFDRELIEQALRNIMKNAVQAMPDGGTLNVQVSVLKDLCKITINDTGKGIPKKDLKRIFDPYYTTRPEGTGLGLMIVNKIVSAHGGEISIMSEENEGTSVIITLPVKYRGNKFLPQRTKRDADEEE